MSISIPKMMGVVSASGGSNIILIDDFTGASATLTGRTPDTVSSGDNWEETLRYPGQTLKTDGSGNAVANGASAIFYANKIMAEQNYYARCVVNLGGGSYMAWVLFDVATPTGTWTWRYASGSSPRWVLIDAAGATVSSNNTQHTGDTTVDLVKYGTKFRVYVNGSLYLSTDALNSGADTSDHVVIGTIATSPATVRSMSIYKPSDENYVASW